ncbi:MAG: O-antigen ligase family protein [Bacteroidota bacterium]|nr:O-antigen ligase family protein [Bacteroidota bacterium]
MDSSALVAGKPAEQPDLRSQQIYFGLCGLFLVGLFFSRALITTVPILLFVFALTRPGLKERFQLLKQNRSALGLLAIYVFLLVSVIYTDNLPNYTRQIYRYAAILFFPLAGGLLPPLNRKQVYALLFFFVLLTTVITIGTMVQYLSNIDTQNQLIIHSQNPPTINRIFHIHFGVMMTLAIFFGVHIFQDRQIIWRKAEKYIALSCVILILVSIHVLAYRTGLLALYVTLIFKIFNFIKNQKRYLLGGSLLALLLIVPVFAYYSLESVQLRVQNTRTDISRYLQHQDINYYSISQRLAAWETAFTVIKRNWVVGVGPADISREMKQQYAIHDFGLIKENQVMIHNQYLHMLMGMGIIGLLLFLGVLISPFWRRLSQNDFCITAFLVSTCTAMMVDSFFELQRGLNLIVFFYFLLIILKEQRMLISKIPLKSEKMQAAVLKQG